MENEILRLIAKSTCLFVGGLMVGLMAGKEKGKAVFAIILLYVGGAL